MERFLATGMVDIRPTGYVPPPMGPEPSSHTHAAWLRVGNDGAEVTDGASADAPYCHALMLAYASDFMLLPTVLRPHGVGLFEQGLQAASLIHSVYHHREVRFDTWNLHKMQSASLSGGVGFATGSIFNADGALVVSTLACTHTHAYSRPRAHVHTCTRIHSLTRLRTWLNNCFVSSSCVVVCPFHSFTWCASCTRPMR